MKLYRPSGLLFRRSGIEKSLRVCVRSEGRRDIKFSLFTQNFFDFFSVKIVFYHMLIINTNSINHPAHLA